MKKDMLKNKRIDDAQLEKVSGGVSLDTSQMGAFYTDRYNELLKNWQLLESYSIIFQNKDFEQKFFELFWREWRNAGFKPDARTFLSNNRNRIRAYAKVR